MDLGMPVMSTGFQTNTSKLFLSKSQSFILHFSDKLPTTAYYYSFLWVLGMDGHLYPFYCYWLIGWEFIETSATILHSTGIIVLLRKVTIPLSTRKLSIPWAVDVNAWIFLRPGWPMIPLYGDGDLTIMKFIKAFVKCSPSPKDTISDICSNGRDIPPLKPKNEVVAGYFWMEFVEAVFV
uniref:Uncharacterized protein n=1 Tax=Tanacetum cinerariifolium TaxID=118510 RepID=A0A699GSK6_TANCI|nr:hypothetical protein [Tanacetum cinerariifolium]